jgi:4-amino-4-deoxychorismate lyase
MLWIDGIATQQAAPLDRGLEFGDGLFETMAVVDGRVRLLERHLDRLALGCARLSIAPPARDLLRAEILRAAQTPDTAVLKLVLTRGDGGLGYAVDPSRPPRRYLVAAPARRRAPNALEQGVRVATLSTPMAIQPRGPVFNPAHLYSSPRTNSQLLSVSNNVCRTAT